jgi:hypothetical protein
MTILYIIISIALLIFILSKIRYNKPLSKKFEIPIERKEYFDKVALKMAEPPEIVYGVDPLQDERIQGRKIGRLQTALIQQKLFVPDDAGDFFYFKEMNGYQIGVTAKWVLKYLQYQIENNKHQACINGAEVIVENVNNGLRNLDYALLEKAGNIKFGKAYKKANGIAKENLAFSIHLVSHKEIKLLLKNNTIIIKNIATRQFEKNVSYCETREYHGMMCGGDYFQLFIGDTLIYKAHTLFY